MDAQPPVGACPAQQVQGEDRDGPRGAFHRLPLPGQGVELLAVDLDRGIHRRDLRDLSAELVQSRLKLHLCYVNRTFFQRPARGVLGIGDETEAQAGLVDLVGVFKEGHGPGRPPDEDRQNAGCHRVQGAAVTHALFVEDAAQLGGNVLGGPACGLVYNQDSVWHGPSFRGIEN